MLVSSVVPWNVVVITNEFSVVGTTILVICAAVIGNVSLPEGDTKVDAIVDENPNNDAAVLVDEI